MIDIEFDVRTDSNDKDPDSASKTLKKYHQFLWSKKLPNGDYFKLESGDSRFYLKYNDIYLGSDSIAITFYNGRNKHLEQFKKEKPDFISHRESVLKKICTIGGYTLLKQIRWSMNQARGCNTKICDRWDLTLECIRRYYANETSPLDTALKKSSDFFDLFVDFKGYVDLFFFQDCVDDNYNVKFWLDTPLFVSNPLPETLESYLAWVDSQVDFVQKRNKRILNYCIENYE